MCTGGPEPASTVVEDRRVAAWPAAIRGGVPRRRVGRLHVGEPVLQLRRHPELVDGGVSPFLSGGKHRAGRMITVLRGGTPGLS